MVFTRCTAKVLLVLASVAIIMADTSPTVQPTGQPHSSSCGSQLDVSLWELFGVSIAVIVLEIIFFTCLYRIGVFYEYAKALSDSSFHNVRNLGYYKRKSLTRASSARLNSNVHEQAVDEKSNHRTSCCSCPCSCCCCCCFEWPDEQYGAHYFALLASKSTFMCCSDLWLPGGRVGWNLFPRGLAEDYILYVFNNHSILSLFLCVRGHPFNTSERMLGYFVQNSYVFNQTCLASFYNFSLKNRYLFKLFIVPSSLMGRKIFYWIMACQCIAEHEKDGYTYAKILACLGRFVAVFFFFNALATFFVGALFGYNAYS